LIKSPSRAAGIGKPRPTEGIYSPRSLPCVLRPGVNYSARLTSAQKRRCDRHGALAEGGLVERIQCCRGFNRFRFVWIHAVPLLSCVRRTFVSVGAFEHLNVDPDDRNSTGAKFFLDNPRERYRKGGAGLG
jgi:hypothetical protein